MREQTAKDVVRTRRIACLVGIVVLLIAGPLSRRIPGLSKEVGDALWAMMVFVVCRLLMPRKRLRLIALLAFVISVADECSQLYSAPWLDAIRATILGHLILGQGFLWDDIAAYLLGITFVALVAALFERRYANGHLLAHL